MRVFFSFTFLSLINVLSAQEIQFLNQYTSNEIGSYATEVLELNEQLLGMLSHDVEMYRISYEMPFMGEQIWVSGAALLPSGFNAAEAYPMLVFNHGTTFVRTSAPSFKDQINNMGYLLSSLGFIVLMPDYVGLGESQIMHPYCHSESESDCGWSFVQAFIASQTEFEVNHNGSLFISGYSQGGHVAMAMAKDPVPASIENEVELRAVSPLSGPYDMSGVQLPNTFAEISYSNPAYLFYILKGWNEVYGDLYTDFSEICNEPYASTIEPMLNGEYSADEINAQCPEILTDLFPEDLIQEVLNDPDHIVMQHAQENDVFEWVPTMPMRINYCTQDEEVFYQNALSAEAWMVGNGAEDVVAYNLGDVNHNTCALPAITMAALWFYSINNGGMTSVLDPALDSSTTCTLYDLLGRVIYEGEGDPKLWPHLRGVYLVQYGAESALQKIYLAK
jgi:hypothetical protein